MSDVHPEPEGIASRVRRLAELLAENDLLRIRIERDGEYVEVGRPHARAIVPVPVRVEAQPAAPSATDVITSDLVGIFRLGRPAPSEGERIESDRELAYVEALGIRNPIRSNGAGRIVAIRVRDGDAVEYGQTLFEVARG